MATYQIPPPATMSLQGDVAENWKDFETSWNYYCIATQLNTKLKTPAGNPDPAGMQLVAATLCAVIGIDGLRVMKSLPNLSEEDKKDPDRILQELRGHFIPQRHVLFERYKFNIATQKDESADEFLIRLRQLAESCEFEALKDSLIRDRLVIGTSDEVCRDRLLHIRPVPDLNRCIELLRASELQKSHKQVMSVGKELQPVDHIQSKRKPWQKKKTVQMKPLDNAACRWCGKSPRHSRNDCKAKETKCHQCGKMGHYAKVCISSEFKSVQEVKGDDVDYVDIPFLGEVKTSNDFWTANLQVNQRPTTFKLDSGVGATIVGNRTPWLKDVSLSPTSREFRGPGGVPLTHRLIGKISNARLTIGDKTVVENIYIMRGQENNLLSKHACYS